MSDLGGFSWANPFPMYLDDGPTEIELVYADLHEAAGVSAGDPTQSALATRPPEQTQLCWFNETARWVADDGSPRKGAWDGLADLEVKVQAIAIGAAMSWVEHAMWEGFPHTMVDGLDAWEKLLGISPIPDGLAARQRAVVLAYTRLADASNPALSQTLYRISPRLSLDQLNQDLWTSSLFGKNFEPYSISPTYRSGAARAIFGKASAWPSYSDAFRARVRYTMGPSETIIPSLVLAQANGTLIEALPAWFTWEVYNLADDGSNGEGFYFDGGPDGDSLFDVTAFGEA